MSQQFYTVNDVQLSENSGKISDIEVLRVGTIQDRGLEITDGMLNDFVDNFKNNVYGTELQVNLGHNREGEAAGWIKDLYTAVVDGVTSLQAKVEWTSLGIEKLKDKLYKFVSAEFSSSYPHAKTGEEVSNVFSGLALTNVPALKGQDPISLSEIKHTNLKDPMFKNYITKLNERAVVSKEDKEMARQLFSELPEAEQAENKAAVESVEAKPEESPEAKAAAEKAAADAKAAEEKAAAEKAAADAKAAEEAAKTEGEKLSEQIKTQSQELAELREWKETTTLSETFEKSLMLSESRATGLSKDKSADAVKFMRTLSEDQRKQFIALMGAVVTVDLSERGRVNAGQALSDKESIQDGDQELAEEMSKKNGKPAHENLQEIYSKRRSAK